MYLQKKKKEKKSPQDFPLKMIIGTNRYMLCVPVAPCFCTLSNYLPLIYLVLLGNYITFFAKDTLVHVV